MDDNRDKDMMRNNLIAIILMVVLVFAWFHFFPPVKNPPPGKNQPKPIQQVQPPKPVEEAPPANAPPPEAWSALPPIPEIKDPAAEEVSIADNDLELVFTDIGGRLKRATINVGKFSGTAPQLVPEQKIPDTEAVYPMGLRLSEEGVGDQLDYRRYEVEKGPDGKSVVFKLTIPGKAVITKHFALTDKLRVLDVKIDYQNLQPGPQRLGMDVTPAYFLNWGPNFVTGDVTSRYPHNLVWFKDGKEGELAVPKLVPPAEGAPNSQSVIAPDWYGVKSTYFLVAMKPDYKDAQGWAVGTPNKYRFGVTAPRFEVAPGATQSNGFNVYLGPMEQKALAAAWTTLPAALRFSSFELLDWFSKLCLRILNWFYGIIPNYGLGIIFVTILVRVVTFPLTIKSMKSMKKMQMLGPEMEELKKKYGEDQQELNKKMMEMYKERGVNPVGGCLPMLLQMPVFIAFYSMLASAYEFRGAPFFFWIHDLSQPDHLMYIPALHGLPFVGAFEWLNLLPILMGLVMVVNQKLTPVSGPSQNPQQKMIMTIMPLFFSYICYNLASGLSLYMITSTALGILQQKFTFLSDVDMKVKKKTPVKRQNFYAAAQARKRQAAKEAKEYKKEKKESTQPPSQVREWIQKWVDKLSGEDKK